VLSADLIQSLEVEYAIFNARRTLASMESCVVETCPANGALLLFDKSRPGSTYTNRILGLNENTLGSLDDLLGRYGQSTPPRIDLRIENATAAVVNELLQRGYRPTAHLCFLAARAATPPPGNRTDNIRRWESDEANSFLDLLEQGSGAEIPAEVRAAKAPYYCTDRFRTFVASVDGYPVAWATMYVTDDQEHGYFANAFTHEEFRGRGIQRDLLRARMHDAVELGLETLVTDVEPGTTSLRNCRRVGFQMETVHAIWEVVADARSD